MSLATATLERFTNVTSALSPVAETPVVRSATGIDYRDHRDEHTFMLYCTEIRDFSLTDSPVGTVIKVAPSSSEFGWLYRHESGLLYRVFGAPLNPVMVNGHYYRALGGRNWLVQYHDEDHLGDRHVASMALNIVAADGVPWPFPSDATALWDASEVPYIEVEAPAQPMDVPQFVEDTSINGRTRGLGEAEADGRVLMNPELEVGGIYIFWSERDDWVRSSSTEARVVRSIENGVPVFDFLGYYVVERVNGEDVAYFYSSRRTVLDSDTTKGWAKLALTTPTATETDTSRWETVKSTELTEFREFNNATNSLAEDNDWCSEYEGIVERLGMEGRTPNQSDYDVRVSVNFSFQTAGSPSGAIDRAVASDHDIDGISLSSATYTGTAAITIRVSDQTNEDDARDYIDSEVVENELSSMMSGAEDIEIDDYTVVSVSETDE